MIINVNDDIIVLALATNYNMSYLEKGMVRWYKGGVFIW